MTWALVVAEPAGTDAMGLVVLAIIVDVELAGPGLSFEARASVVVRGAFLRLQILSKKGFISLNSE